MSLRLFNRIVVRIESWLSIALFFLVRPLVVVVLTRSSMGPHLIAKSSEYCVKSKQATPKPLQAPVSFSFRRFENSRNLEVWRYSVTSQRCGPGGEGWHLEH